MVKKIKLNQDKFALVDDEDYEWLNQWKWFNQPGRKTFYAIRQENYLTIRMHHLIMGKPPEGFVTDHKDGNGLNNTRANLHHVSQRENMQNMRNLKYASKYPGVIWDNFTNKWKAQIKINGKLKALGRFNDEKEAYNKYLEADQLIKEGNEDKIKPHKHKFKYVSWKKQIGKWVARKTYNNKRYFLGYYNTEDEALNAVKEFDKKKGIK